MAIAGGEEPDHRDRQRCRGSWTAAPEPPARGAGDAGRAGLSAEETRAVVHLADFALPADRGDYGSGAVERMASRNTFVAILEFGPECLGTALYRAQGIPRTDARLFNPNGLQRRIEGSPVAGRRVLAVEDTSTTGGSVLTAVQALREAGAEVVGVAVIVDRDTGAREAIESEGLAYRYAISAADLGLVNP